LFWFGSDSLAGCRPLAFATETFRRLSCQRHLAGNRREKAGAIRKIERSFDGAFQITPAVTIQQQMIITKTSN